MLEEKMFRTVSMEDAKEFLELKRKNASKLAGAVALCILSPVILIFLAGLSDSHIGNITEELAAGLGLTVLLVMVAAAVFVFISCGIKSRRFEYFEKENFETTYAVKEMVSEKKRSFESKFAVGIGSGVVCCIVAPIPLIVVGVMNAPDYIYTTFVSVLLILVAVGVYLLVRTGIVNSSYDSVLQEGEYTTAAKNANSKMQLLNTVYWCLATALYLGWSFITMRWDYTWIVWPVAGVLFGAIVAIAKLVMRVDDTK